MLQISNVLPKYFTMEELERGTPLHAAARLVDRYGHPDGKVTRSEIWKLERMLHWHDAVSALGHRELSFFSAEFEEDIPVLRQNLSELKKLVHGYRRMGPTQRFTTIPVHAIADKKIQKCAQAICEFCGSRTEKKDRHLNLNELAQAFQLLEAIEQGPVTKEDEAVVKKLQAAYVTNDEGKKELVFTRKNLEAMREFMRNGLGDLLKQKPISIRGHVFTEVYCLDNLTETGKYSSSKSTMGAVIDKVEELMADSRYDRIYLQGKDKSMYVALSPKGSLHDIKEGYSYSELDGGKDAGIVYRAVNIQNSVWEATGGFWMEKIKWVANLIQGKFLDMVEKNSKNAVGTVVGAATAGTAATAAAGAANHFGVQLTKQQLITAGLGVAGVGAALLNLPVAMQMTTATGAIVTAINLYDYLRKNYDKAPLYMAMGASVNRKEKIRD